MTIGHLHKSVKIPFVTKNSKHLVETSGDDSSAVIEFTQYLMKKKKSVEPPFVSKR